MSKVKSEETLHLTYKEDLLKGKSLPDLARYVFGPSKSWGVVIGINNYSEKKGWKPLPYAVDDAKAVKDYLVRYPGFTDDHIIELYNATKTDILSRLGDDLRNKVNKDDRVFVFFSGHGDTIKQSTDHWTSLFRLMGIINRLLPVSSR